MKNNILKIRTQRKETLARVGHFVGVSAQAVSAWERGIKTPRMKYLMKLSRHWKMPVEKIYTF